jgi:hypothetical protein
MSCHLIHGSYVYSIRACSDQRYLFYDVCILDQAWVYSIRACSDRRCLLYDVCILDQTWVYSMRAWLDRKCLFYDACILDQTWEQSSVEQRLRLFVTDICYVCLDFCLQIILLINKQKCCNVVCGMAIIYETSCSTILHT